jgi:hypothetical protein
MLQLCTHEEELLRVLAHALRLLAVTSLLPLKHHWPHC